MNCDHDHDAGPYILRRFCLTNVSVIRAIKWRFPAFDTSVEA